MFFPDGVLVLSEEHRLLLAPEVGELPLERRQRQGLRVVPPDDGVDDLRRDLHHPDDVRDVALVPPDLRGQRLRAGYPPLVDEPLLAARLSMVSILFSFIFNCFALEIESLCGTLWAVSTKEVKHADTDPKQKFHH